MGNGESYKDGHDPDLFETKVDDKFLCPICFRVLRDPKQCSNQHYFCKSCIQRHLHQVSQTCPICQQHLTEETLAQPPRLLTEILSPLKLRCDNARRGCPEFVELQFLDRHVKNCGYSPTSCTNPGCKQIFNKRDKERHENELCPLLMMVCRDCGRDVLRKKSRVHPCFVRKDVDNLATRLDVVQNDMTEVKDQVNQMKLTQDEFMTEVRDMMTEMMAAATFFSQQSAKAVQDLQSTMNERINRLIANQETLREELHEKLDEITRSQAFNHLQDILVCGGKDDKDLLKSVESYSWSQNTWTEEPPMKEKRSGASAFVHESQIFVTGGFNGRECFDSIESINVGEKQKKWTEFPVKMPIACRDHKTVCHGNSTILTCGNEGNKVNDGIYAMQLNPPHTTNYFLKIPEPRCGHGCEIIDNQVLIAGGASSIYFKDFKNTVYSYDINTNECKTLPALPSPICDMATVSWQGNMILIGGLNENFQTLNTVIVYNVKAGKIKMLPAMKYKRAGCAAVITRNVIVVLGGYDYETESELDSVECFDLNSSLEWRELPRMISKRSYLVATVIPGS